VPRDQPRLTVLGRACASRARRDRECLAGRRQGGLAPGRARGARRCGIFGDRGKQGGNGRLERGAGDADAAPREGAGQQP
jgi:hypothetical protein